MLLQSVSKQWGKILGDTVNLKIINFPVSFNECFGGLALFNGDPVAAAEYATITDITNTNFKIYMYANNAGTGYANANIFYLFLGAQQQWGFTVFDPVYYKNVNFTLPLSVNGTFCAFSTGYDAKGSTFLWHSMSHFNNVNVGVTGFVFDSRYTFTGLGYLAICWQKQWGINTGGAVRTSTLPIPFTNVFLAVASTSSEWCCPGCSATNTTVTTRAYQSNRPDVAQPNDVNWIIIGCQPQWGYCSSRTATFPIPFPTAALFIVAVPKTTSTSATATGAEYLGTTSVNLYLHGTSGWYFVGGH